MYSKLPSQPRRVLPRPVALFAIIAARRRRAVTRGRLHRAAWRKRAVEHRPRRWQSCRRTVRRGPGVGRRPGRAGHWASEVSRRRKFVGRRGAGWRAPLLRCAAQLQPAARVSRSWGVMCAGGRHADVSEPKLPFAQSSTRLTSLKVTTGV